MPVSDLCHVAGLPTTFKIILIEPQNELSKIENVKFCEVVSNSTPCVFPCPLFAVPLFPSHSCDGCSTPGSSITSLFSTKTRAYYYSQSLESLLRGNKYSDTLIARVCLCVHTRFFLVLFGLYNSQLFTRESLVLFVLLVPQNRVFA